MMLDFLTPSFPVEPEVRDAMIDGVHMNSVLRVLLRDF